MYRALAVPIAVVMSSMAIPLQAKEVVTTDMLVHPPADRQSLKIAKDPKDFLPVVVLDEATKREPEARMWMGIQAKVIRTHSDSSQWTKGVICKLTIAPDGSIKELKIQKSSNDKVKDANALAMLRNAAPYRALPPFIKEQSMLVELLEYPRLKMTALKGY